MPTRGLVVDGDEARLVQVVSNLLSNAARYTPAGGHLQVRAAAEDGHAVLRVRDDGVGIEPDALPRIFDMYFQASRSRARRSSRAPRPRTPRAPRRTLARAPRPTRAGRTGSWSSTTTRTARTASPPRSPGAVTRWRSPTTRRRR